MSDGDDGVVVDFLLPPETRARMMNAEELHRARINERLSRNWREKMMNEELHPARINESLPSESMRLAAAVQALPDDQYQEFVALFRVMKPRPAPPQVILNCNFDDLTDLSHVFRGTAEPNRVEVQEPQEPVSQEPKVVIITGAPRK